MNYSIDCLSRLKVGDVIHYTYAGDSYSCSFVRYNDKGQIRAVFPSCGETLAYLDDCIIIKIVKSK